jgi:DnaJ-class molecular chaperone
MTILAKDKDKCYDIICQPENHGYITCLKCKGYGNDNRDDDSVVELCDFCGGDGVVPMTEKEVVEKTHVIMDESGFSSGVGIV